MPEQDSSPDKMAALRDQIARMERGRYDGPAPSVTIAPDIDAALPDHGLTLGALHDIVAPSEEGMASALGFCTVVLARTIGAIIWIEREPDAYAPGLRPFGLAMARLVYAPAPNTELALWAMEESLRCPEVGGVLLVLGAAEMDLTAARRLQLAAEAGGCLGLILRWKPPSRSVAQTRWRIAPLPSIAGGQTIWQVDLQHSRRGRPQSWWTSWEEDAQELRVLPGGAFPAR